MSLLTFGSSASARNPGTLTRDLKEKKSAGQASVASGAQVGSANRGMVESPLEKAYTPGAGRMIASKPGVDQGSSPLNLGIMGTVATGMAPAPVTMGPLPSQSVSAPKASPSKGGSSKPSVGKAPVSAGNASASTTGGSVLGASTKRPTVSSVGNRSIVSPIIRDVTVGSSYPQAVSNAEKKASSNNIGNRIKDVASKPVSSLRSLVSNPGNVLKELQERAKKTLTNLRVGSSKYYQSQTQLKPTYAPGGKRSTTNLA